MRYIHISSDDSDSSTYPETGIILIRLPIRYEIVEPDFPKTDKKDLRIPDPDYPLKYVSLPIPPHKSIGRVIKKSFAITFYARKQMCSKSGFLARKARLRRKGKA